MNRQLIDKLLHKAGARFGAEGIDYSSFTSSKFAELIVAECAEYIDFAIFSNGGIDGRSLKEHFGVEE